MSSLLDIVINIRGHIYYLLDKSYCQNIVNFFSQKQKYIQFRLSIELFFFFFFNREFQPMTSAFDDVFYHQTNIPIGFWCKRGLNLKSLIQPLETLPVELTGIHNKVAFGLSDFSLF